MKICPLVNLDGLVIFGKISDKKILALLIYRIDKLTGALYLGELVRRILIQFTLDGILFNGKPCEKLDEVDSFPTKYISEILRQFFACFCFTSNKNTGHYVLFLYERINFSFS